MWIWQQADWPNFTYSIKEILPVLEETLSTVSPLVLLTNELDPAKRLQLESQALLDEALSTAKIEGELLDRDSVRSSIANRLGVGTVNQISKSSQVFVDVLLESIRSASTPLTEAQLFSWHAAMFIEKPILDDLIIGDYRATTMQVISGRFGLEKIHFEAPCSEYLCVQQEMGRFLKWLENDHSHSGYIKAAIAKFWFVTVHPFDDGNGRFSRIIAERCLANMENTNNRLYSLSSEIERNRNDYYALLEKCQKGNLDLTQWIIWFLQQITAAASVSMVRLNKIRQATRFWDDHRGTVMNERQLKLVNRLLETTDFEKGLSRRKYKNLVNTSDATAARDLKDLLNKKVLFNTGRGRGVKYFVLLECLSR